MPGYGYFPGPDWDWFSDSLPQSRYEWDDAGSARENAPAKVLREMAVVFATSLAVVLLIDAAVLLLSVPLKAFHIG